MIRSSQIAAGGQETIFGLRLTLGTLIFYGFWMKEGEGKVRVKRSRERLYCRLIAQGGKQQFSIDPKPLLLLLLSIMMMMMVVALPKTRGKTPSQRTHPGFKSVSGLGSLDKSAALFSSSSSPFELIFCPLPLGCFKGQTRD